MIIVTSPGDWAQTYWPLQHAQWHGWTPTDLVFPAFLFAVGMALGLSFPRSLTNDEERRAFWFRLVRRAVALVLLGLLLNWTYVLSVEWGAPPAGPDDHPALRLPGVPQRIAFCYVLAALIIVLTGTRDEQQRTAINSRAICLTIAVLLTIYWALLAFVPVPGFGAGRLDQIGSLPAYVDRIIFTPPHLWPLGSVSWRGPVTYDPEGLLSSFPATVNVLLGVLAGTEWRRPSGPRLVWIARISGLLVISGLLLDPLFPINKRIWTSSFALLSSGFSGLLLVAVVIAMRRPRIGWLLTPLKVLGGNAVLAFSISIILGSFAALPLGGPSSSPQSWGNGIALSFISDEYLASLACAIAILILITIVIWPLHRRAIHLRL
jgi:predicted acyltransferase